MWLNRNWMNRRRGVLTFPVALFLVAIASGCGSSDDESPTTATNSATPGASGTAQPSRVTSSPEPSATPAPTETASPAPSTTPIQLTFDVANAGSGTKTPTSSGPFGVVYAESGYKATAATNRLQAFALVQVGINERPSASAWLSNPFRAQGEGSEPVTARISTGVNWNGVLAGNGAAGTRASVTITLSVLEDGDVIATEKVHELVQSESALTVGGYDDIGREDADMEVALIAGRLYELRLTLTCAAGSGLLGVVTHCVYSDSGVYEDGFVEWEPRSILFVP